MEPITFSQQISFVQYVFALVRNLPQKR